MLNLASFPFPAASSRHAVLRRALGLVRLTLLAECGLMMVGCSAAEAPGYPDTTTGGAGAEGDGDVDTHQTITFTETSTLELAPSGVAQITAIVSPALRQTVMFEILADSEPFDGYLTGNNVVVAGAGTASVAVHAPSEPTDFQIRASLVTGEDTLRAVAVKVQGLGRVRVIPVYSGTRDVSKWYASAWPGLSCDQLESTLEKGPHTASSTTRPLIENIPAGTMLAVSMRGDKLASGCSTVTQISTDQEVSVEVTMTDSPVNVASGQLRLTLGVDAATELAAILDTAIADSIATLIEEYPSDTHALLSLMRSQLSATDQTAFDQLVSSDDVIQDVESQLSSPTAISDTVRAILTNASVYMEGPEIFEAELTLNGLESQFTLLSATSIDAETAGFEVPDDWQLEVQTGDKVSLGGELLYDPIRWLGEIAEAEAESEPDSDPPTLIAQAAACAGVAEVLAAHLGETQLEQCDAACLLATCTSQVAALWEEIKASGQPASLLIGASGDVSLNGDAEISTLVGSWVGKTGGSTASLKGPVTGQQR